MTLVGYRRRSFKAPDTGDTVSGYYLFFTRPDPNVQGLAAECVFVSDRKIGDYKPVVGDELQVFYNRFGKVDSLSVLSVS